MGTVSIVYAASFRPKPKVHVLELLLKLIEVFVSCRVVPALLNTARALSHAKRQLPIERLKGELRLPVSKRNHIVFPATSNRNGQEGYPDDAADCTD